MVALSVSSTVNPSIVIETEIYRCVIDVAESMVSITTDLGPVAARRFAEFEADRANVSVSLIFSNDGTESKTYLFRLRHLGCLEDEGKGPTEDPYQDLTQKKVVNPTGCPHSKRTTRATCSLCIQAAEKAELVRLIKEGKL
jgi:hypothetical protein